MGEEGRGGRRRARFIRTNRRRDATTTVVSSATNFARGILFVRANRTARIPARRLWSGAFLKDTGRLFGASEFLSFLPATRRRVRCRVYGVGAIPIRWFAPVYPSLVRVLQLKPLRRALAVSLEPARKKGAAKEGLRSEKTGDDTRLRRRRVVE